MKRVITITMDINESTHKATMEADYTEDGNPKSEWRIGQAISTAYAMMEAAQELLEGANDYLINGLSDTEEQK